MIMVYRYCRFIYIDIECIRNGGFDRSPEGSAAGLVMDAYEQADQNKMKEVTSKQIFTFLDNQVIIYIKSS